MSVTSAVLVFVLTCLVGCSSDVSEDLPPVREPEILAAPVACVAAPPPPPFLEPVARPLDPISCFPKHWHRTVPAELSVVDGVVKAVRFYDQCEGREVELPPEVAACMASVLRTWRYPMAELPCPGHALAWTEYVSVRPPSPGSSARTCADGTP
jgi:hypothetical protein